jgi:hypothetical protein
MLDLAGSNTLRFQVNNNASTQATAGISVEVWHHVAGIHSAGKLELWVDGVKAMTASGTPSGVTTDKPLTIGGWSTSLTDYAWEGDIGPVRVSNIVRYTSTFTPSWGWATDANTLAAWNFKDGEGTVLTDDSAGKHHGSIQGPVWKSIPCP